MAMVISIGELRARVGQELAVTDWLVMMQEQVGRFAEATGDKQWIHVDVERAAKESPYGGTIAHGFFTLSLLSQFMKEAAEIEGVRMAVNYGLNRVRFPAPVMVGVRIRGRFTVVTVKDVEGGVEVVYGVTVEVEGGAKPCCVAEWVVRYYQEHG